MASSSSSSHSAPSSSSRLGKYEVFLSFRGEDTRRTFVDHLYSALVQKAIYTYKDDEKLPRGESIGPSLRTAIEESRIAVIVFSKNYADSWWCLEELSYIMKCKDERGTIVMPIFYDVEPSQVRKQEGDFGQGFVKQVVKNSTKVELWRKALVDASELAGWEPKNVANGHESQIIKKIVDTILDRLFYIYSDVDEDLVGMKARLEDLNSLLDLESCDVRMVGIWGVGGSGKTTLASSSFMKLSRYFEGHCIVDNIREESDKHGLKTLQEKILSSVLKTQVVVQSVEQGKNIMKNRLCHCSVLLLLDDVDKLEQLEALAGSHNWFGKRSRIIITTRDEHLLRTHKVDVYPVRFLSDNEATQLFHKHAYNKEKPIKGYKELSLRVIHYAHGLPLALKVLGSFLYDKDKKGWMSALKRLKATPKMEIVEKLKISYDGLEKEEKELFLDIACFFRRRSVDDAMEILDASGFHPEIGIHVLRQKALITTYQNGKFDMHDLVEEMAHYIVRGEYPSRPENQSRVWKREEIDNMCFGDATMENDKIEAIPYYYWGSSSHISKLVSNMKRLRWLKVYTRADEKNDGGSNFGTSCLRSCPGLIMKNDRHDGGPTFLSNELRYIHWKWYPGSSFPDSFQAKKLVVLKMSDSLQKQLWKGNKHLPHLKVLKLKFMEKLVSTPDFNGLPCLKKLTLRNCGKLKEIHPSLGNHTSLEYVKVYWCDKLRMFPRIIHMEKLKTLRIESCSKIRDFPEVQGNMESLVKLSLWGRKLEVVSSSIGEHCTNLVSLHLEGCYKLKSIEFDLDALKHLEEFIYDGLKNPFRSFESRFPHSLRNLSLGGRRLKDRKIPFGIGELSNLEKLSLSGWHDFKRVDFSLLQLTQLKRLSLSSCKRLVELPELPSGVAIFKADNCRSLKAVGDINRNCKWLCQVSLVKGGIIKDGGRLLELMLEGKAVENGTMVLQLEGVEIAKGFTPACVIKGDTFRMQLGENWCNDCSGFLMCAVFRRDFRVAPPPPRINMKQVKSGMESQHDDIEVGGWKESDGDSKYWTWVGYVSFALLSHTCWWDPTYNHLSFHIELEGIKCIGFGVRLVERKCASQPITETSSTPPSSHLSPNYTPAFNILNDSAHALDMTLELNC